MRINKIKTNVVDKIHWIQNIDNVRFSMFMVSGFCITWLDTHALFICYAIKYTYETFFSDFILYSHRQLFIYAGAFLAMLYMDAAPLIWPIHIGKKTTYILAKNQCSLINSFHQILNIYECAWIGNILARGFIQFTVLWMCYCLEIYYK